MRVALRDTFRADDDGIVKDGERVRVPMLVMDGADGHRGGMTTDAQLNAIRAPALQARDAYVARLQNAWKQRPHQDAAMASIHSSPEELMRSHLEGEAAETDPDKVDEERARLRAWPNERDGIAAQERALEKARDAIHRAQCDRLENAWKQGKAR